MSDIPPACIADTIAIVGVGLIGGSLGGALRRRRACRRVLGVGRQRARLEAAQAAGLLDDVACDLAAAAAQADLLVFCTPVDQIAAQVRVALSAARPGTTATDAGSVKGAICAELADFAAGERVFVGAHPIAGSERTGYEAADAQLFADKLCVVTPVPGQPEAAVTRVERLWRAVGMQVRRMSPADHDAALAKTSHVPHFVAAALAATLSPDHLPLTGTGFRDATRIAAGDPDLWTAIALQNAAAIDDGLADVQRVLAEFQTALRRGDAASLKKLLQTAKTVRDALS